MYMTTNSPTHDQFISWALSSPNLPVCMAWLHYSLSLTEESVIATDAQSRDAISTLPTDLLQTQPYNHFRL
jgi:hypothetical protein